MVYIILKMLGLYFYTLIISHKGGVLFFGKPVMSLFSFIFLTYLNLCLGSQNMLKNLEKYTKTQMTTQKMGPLLWQLVRYTK